ncbi:MAG TPA: DinB family protein [Chitinophagaceae bacterium]|nr:DinB family protein [Chitinophagaceae bacterium]
MAIYNKAEIEKGLEEKVNAINQYISALNLEQFEATPGNKWSAGQNLDHLIRSIRPLQVAYSLPKIMLKIMFGRANRPSKTYEELVEKYNTRLSAGGRASGIFIPKTIVFSQKDRLIRKYNNQKQQLISKIRKQSEEDLDKYILPHPLLGKITLREMLFFTIYHNEHHLRILLERK